MPINEIVPANRILIFSFLSYILFAFVFWGWNHGGVPAAFLASILHVLMVHVLVWKFAKSLFVDTKRIFSPFSIFFAVNLFYFSITFLKYFRSPNYLEFTTDIIHRLFGAFLVFLSMLILLRWWTWWSSRNPDKVLPALHQLGGSRSFWLVIFTGCILAASGVYFINMVVELTPSRMPIVDRNIGIYLSIITSLFFPMLVAALFIKKGIIRNVSLGALIISAFVVMIFAGVRTYFMITLLLLLLFSLYGLKCKSNVMTIAMVYFLIVPLVVIAIAVPLTNYVKRGIDTDLVETAERGELADYAINICSFDKRPSAFTFLSNAAQWALLGDRIDKTSLDKTEVSVQYANRWRIKEYRNGYAKNTVDYLDTVFSSGAYLGGYIGLIFFPLFWIGSFIWFIRKCSGLLSVTAFLMCYMVVCNIELSVWAVIAIWRNYLVTTIMMYFVFKFFMYLNKIKFKLVLR